jgi:branched-chain amino acid aminotransferase
MTERKIWMDGSLVNWDDAKIHVLTHALHYATAVFEGIRCYKTNEGLSVFRLSEHIRRLLNSCKIYSMPVNYTGTQLQNAIIQTVKANGMDEYYVRPIVYYAFGKMGVNPLPNKVSVAIAAWIWDEQFGNSGKGVRLTVSSWTRIDARSMPILAKATANYANSALARVEALKRGFDGAVMLNSYGNVAEASAENIFIVEEGSLTTPPVSSGALRGITRDSVITLSNDLSIRCHITDICREDLYTAEEVFLTGTASGITPVIEIDDHTIGNGKIGAITKELRSSFKEICRGKEEKYRSTWLTPVI